MTEATTGLVKVQATKLNTTTHIGDGRKLRGPYADENGEVVDGEIAADVPADVAELIKANKMGKVVR